MILESIVTTKSEDGSVNASPMGPLITGGVESGFELRPYETSTTLANLKRHPQGVLHVTDDVWLFAQAAIGKLDEVPPYQAAEKVEGAVLKDACRWYEFEVTYFDESNPRASLNCKTVHQGRLRDFWGFNRGKHAVIEAAILATRVSFLPAGLIEEQYETLQKSVDKTGGESEIKAMKMLQEYVANSRE